MRTSTYSHLLAIAVFACGATRVSADDNPNGFYLGGGAGQFNVELDVVEENTGFSETFDGDAAAFKVFAGYRVLPYLAFELDYLDFGEAEDTIAGFDLGAEVTGWAPYILGTLPAGPFELFARVGYLFFDAELTVEGLGSAEASAEELVYGGGVGVTLFERVHARLEYEVLDVSELDRANALWLSAAWRF